VEIIATLATKIYYTSLGTEAEQGTFDYQALHSMAASSPHNTHLGQGREITCPASRFSILHSGLKDFDITFV
jgi:hypothetical protein